MNSRMQTRQEAIEAGQFETKMIAPPMETKPGIPHRAAEKVDRIIDRVEEEARRSGGEPVSEARRRELERRCDRLLERIAKHRNIAQRRARGRPRTNGERRSEGVSGDLPAWPVYSAAQRMRRLCMELIGDLLPTPTPLIRWRDPQALARKHKPGTQGLCSKQNGVVMVELSNELDPRNAALVCAHELCHAAQLYGGMRSPSDSQRDEAERQARRFSIIAMQKYAERHGTPPKG